MLKETLLCLTQKRFIDSIAHLAMGTEGMAMDSMQKISIPGLLTTQTSFLCLKELTTNSLRLSAEEEGPLAGLQ